MQATHNPIIHKEFYPRAAKDSSMRSSSASYVVHFECGCSAWAGLVRLSWHRKPYRRL